MPPVFSNCNITINSFPQGVTQINVTTDVSTYIYEAPGTDNVEYLTGLQRISVFCPEGTVLPNMELLGAVMTQSEDSAYDSVSGSYDYNDVSRLTIEGAFTIAFAPAITDLTGTKWVLNTTLSQYIGGVIPEEQPLADELIYTLVKDPQAEYWGDINFSSNGQNFIAIGGAESAPLSGGDYIAVLSAFEWIDESYRTITITGGADATNPDFIIWLEYNATQVPVVDLTGTEWLINSTPDCSSLSTYTLNYTSDSTSYISLITTGAGSGIYPQNTLVYRYGSGRDDYNQVYTNSWASENYRTISITDGTDVSNPDFIVWLTNNATIQESSSPEITIGTLSLASVYCNGNITKIILNGVTLYEKIYYPIIVTLTNATASQSNPSVIAEDGTATLVFTFDGTNYICPSTSPTVTGATGTWTKNSDSQGTMVLSNANGNVSFSVAGEQALPQLDTPTNLSVTDNVASFDEVENAEKYEFFVDDISIGEYPTVSLIEFSVIIGASSSTYQAEDGMTWEQWVTSSEYNPDLFQLSGNNVIAPGSGGRFVAILGTAVLKTDTIVANQAYDTVAGD